MQFHYVNTPIQKYIENFTFKTWKFSDKQLIFFYISRRGGSNEYQQSMFWAEIWKYQIFYLKSFSFGDEIFYIFE